MNNDDPSGIEEFLKLQPLMALRPSANYPLRFTGTYKLDAEHPTSGRIVAEYDLEILVPTNFPRSLPIVSELSTKIPRDGPFHINKDESLCLGSPMGLMIRLRKDPSLAGFAASCINPYLYAVSKKLGDGKSLVFGELKHGLEGEFDDYMEILGLSSHEKVQQALILLGKKKRIANKKLCPCNCERRLGKCERTNKPIRFLRELIGCKWFRSRHGLIVKYQKLEAAFKAKEAAKLATHGITADRTEEQRDDHAA